MATIPGDSEMKFSFLIALMLPVWAQAAMFAPYEWPVEAYDTCLDKVNYEVNLKYKDVKYSCVPNAVEKSKMARDVCGVHGNVVRLAPYSGSMDHAVFIVGDQVLDNGAISPDIFHVSDIDYYGDVMDTITPYEGDVTISSR